MVKGLRIPVLHAVRLFGDFFRKHEVLEVDRWRQETTAIGTAGNAAGSVTLRVLTAIAFHGLL